MEDSSTNKRIIIPPFLSKCYDLIDDPVTDPIISWGSIDTSFVILDRIAFEQELLPKYFKHSNFSSFMRQLNSYGFKKSDPDRWEFTNDRFIKGQKHLLRNINRRKSTQGLGQQNQSQQKNTSAEDCVEVGEFGLWEDVENLKKDKNVVMQELVEIRHHQQGADSKLHRLRQRLQGMEINQQQMLSFLAMVVQSPGFLGQVLQQNESNWHIAETSKKRPFLALEQGTEVGEPVASDGQIVRYQPQITETPKPLLMPASNSDGSQQLNPSENGWEDFLKNIGLMSSEDGLPVPMEEDLLCENEGPFVFSDLLEDGILEKLLLDNSLVENIERTEPNTQETLENRVELESTNRDTLVGSFQSLDHLSEQLGHLASETNNTDGER